MKENNIPVKTKILVLLTLFLFSCSNNTFESKEDLIEYLKDEDNGYFQKKNIKGIDFRLMYKPTDLLVEQELGIQKEKKIDSLREKYSKFIYFNLSMSVNNKDLLRVIPKDQDEFGAMVNNLAYGMVDKVNLYNNKKDTIELIDYIYPRMFGMSKSTSIMFVYPRNVENLKEDYLYFTVKDLGLMTGEIKFKINNKKIVNEPVILFKK